MSTEPDVAELKQADREEWAAGNYASFAELIADEPPRVLLAAAGVEPGMKVLDVATGTGNVALPAAEAGAEVVGLDLTPELFAVARKRAEAAGVEVDWIEGDAEQLPFEEETFDRVLSAFGVMFAPRHEVAAAELVRVTKSGGAFAVVNWRPQNYLGALFELMGEYSPPPPSYVLPPPLWGVEEHVTGLFEDSGVELEFEPASLVFRFDSPEAFAVFLETELGPMIMTKERLESEGRWEEFRNKMLELFETHDQSQNDGLQLEQDYLVTIGRKLRSAGG